MDEEMLEETTTGLPKPTPGPWRISEQIPWNEGGAMWTRTPEGYDAIKGGGIGERHIAIHSSTAAMQDIYGSSEGGHVAEVQITMSEEGRRQALANALLMAAAPELAEQLAEALELFAGDDTAPDAAIRRAQWVEETRKVLDKAAGIGANSHY